MIYTYFIAGAGMVKIGKTRNVASRLRALQMGSPVRLKMLHQVQGDYESELHEHFKDKRAHGEWFTLDIDILAFIDQVKRHGPAHVIGTPAPTVQAMPVQSAKVKMVAQALQSAGGNRSSAARALGMSRRTVQRIANRHNLTA